MRIVRAHFERAAAKHGIDDEIPVRQKDAFGRACRAGGINDTSQRVRLHRRDFHRHDCQLVLALAVDS